MVSGKTRWAKGEGRSKKSENNHTKLKKRTQKEREGWEEGEARW